MTQIALLRKSACLVRISIFMELDYHVSRAELFWKGGEIEQAIQSAEKALACNCRHEQNVALWIFIARAKSKIGNYEESNQILRRLIDEKIFLPPIILTLFYNSLKSNKIEKAASNINLIKLFLGNENAPCTK